MQYSQLKIKINSLKPRERWLVICSLILLSATVVYGLAFYPLYSAINNRTARITQKQQDIVWLRSMAGQLGALGNSQLTNSSKNESLVKLIADSVVGSKLASALTGQIPNGQQSVKAQFENANFNDLIIWVDQLQKSQGIQVAEASITETPQAGQVNASISFTR